MAKIAFDIKYRPEIESGKYKVVERSTNRECTFLSKDDLVIVYFNGIAYVFDYEKSIFRCQMGYGEFDILTDEPELTDFEKAYLRSKHHVEPEDILPEFLSINKVRENAQKLLDVARKQLQPEIDAEIDKAYKNSDAVQYRRGKEAALKELYSGKEDFKEAVSEKIRNMGSRVFTSDGNVTSKEFADEFADEFAWELLALAKAEAYKDLPKWQHMYSGAGGNGEGRNTFLIRDSLDTYRLSPVIVAGDTYLVLHELDKLPK